MEEYAVFYPPNGKNYTIASSSGRLKRYRFVAFFLKYVLTSSITNYVLLLFSEIH